MNAIERDDFAHALGQTMEFYGKTLDKTQFAFWLRGMDGKPIHAIKSALIQYTKVGRYAPKPVDILDLIEAGKSREQAHLPPPKPEPNNCPPEVSAAWWWFLGRCTQDSENFAGVFDTESDISTEMQERYLHIVNHEAKRCNAPDAIPDEFKLREVWG